MVVVVMVTAMWESRNNEDVRDKSPCTHANKHEVEHNNDNKTGQGGGARRDGRISQIRRMATCLELLDGLEVSALLLDKFLVLVVDLPLPRRGLVELALDLA